MIDTSGWSARKTEYLRNIERLFPDWESWSKKTRYFYKTDTERLKFLIPKGKRVLELGSGRGDLLGALEPSLGVGVDFCDAMIDHARKEHPDLVFVHGDIEDPALIESLKEHGPFDVILLSDTLDFLDDIVATLESAGSLCEDHTRLIVTHYSHLWEPVLTLAEYVGLRKPVGRARNWLAPRDLEMFFNLVGLETIHSDMRQLIPVHLFGIGDFINRLIAPLPIIRRLCVRSYTTARRVPAKTDAPPSLSVIVPVRNEMGNVEDAVRRLPPFGAPTEIIYVEGNSSDGTWDEVLRVKAEHGDKDISAHKQPGIGKADAVWTGFDAAKGDILVILDGDLTVPPEDLTKFYRAIVSGNAEFVNGTRMIYPLEKDSMRFLNYLANRAFAYIFSFLIGQRLSDTLCGTKMMRRSDYERLKAGRAFFGDFDPFGDFDLLFGAAKMNLKILEVPVRYRARTYGETQISRFRHGVMLLRMVIFAYRKFKMS